MFAFLLKFYKSMFIFCYTILLLLFKYVEVWPKGYRTYLIEFLYFKSCYYIAYLVKEINLLMNICYKAEFNKIYTSSYAIDEK